MEERGEREAAMPRSLSKEPPPSSRGRVSARVSGGEAPHHTLADSARTGAQSARMLSSRTSSAQRRVSITPAGQPSPSLVTARRAVERRPQPPPSPMERAVSDVGRWFVEAVWTPVREVASSWPHPVAELFGWREEAGEATSPESDSDAKDAKDAWRRGALSGALPLQAEATAEAPDVESDDNLDTYRPSTDEVKQLRDAPRYTAAFASLRVGALPAAVSPEAEMVLGAQHAEAAARRERQAHTPLHIPPLAATALPAPVALPAPTAVPPPAQNRWSASSALLPLRRLMPRQLICATCGAPRTPAMRFCGQCGMPTDPADEGAREILSLAEDLSATLTLDVIGREAAALASELTAQLEQEAATLAAAHFSGLVEMLLTDVITREAFALARSRPVAIAIRRGQLRMPHRTLSFETRFRSTMKHWREETSVSARGAPLTPSSSRQESLRIFSARLPLAHAPARPAETRFAMCSPNTYSPPVAAPVARGVQDQAAICEEGMSAPSKAALPALASKEKMGTKAEDEAETMPTSSLAPGSVALDLTALRAIEMAPEDGFDTFRL